METPQVVDEYIDDVTSPTVLYTVVGVAGASVLATAFAFIPFDALPLGNVLRTGALLGLGAYVIHWGQDQFNPGYESMANVAGGLLFTAGFVTAVASTTAALGVTIPGMSKLQELLSPSSTLGAEGLGGGAMAGGTGIMSGIDDEVNTLPQQGSGRVIGQSTLTMSTSDIKNAEEYEWDFIPMTEDMANRYPASDMMASVQEQAPLGHGVTQNFGAEVSNTTEAITPGLDMDGAHSATDTMGWSKMDPFQSGTNPFVESIHPTTPSYQPPVWYAEDEPTMEQPAYPTPTPEVGGVQDVWTTYIRPSHTLGSAHPSAHGVQEWFGAENQHVTYLGRHMAAAEGSGHVIGQ